MPNSVNFTIGERSGVEEQAAVRLQRAAAVPTGDQALWAAIRNRTDAIAFNRYRDFIEQLFCIQKEETFFSAPLQRAESVLRNSRCGMDGTRLSIHAVDSFNVLKLATEVFLLLECGVGVYEKNAYPVPDSVEGPLFDPDEERGRMDREIDLSTLEGKVRSYLGNNANVLPYLHKILETFSNTATITIPDCLGVLERRAHCPCLLELIWSYWHEEGMQVQAINAIALRFQNRRGRGERDPLAELEINPLQPLNNLFWGYIQSEYSRLNVPRRAYEYDHHYGLSLYGKATPKLNSADSRSKFLEGFHQLLNRTALFYRDDADTTVIADAYPLLNGLREVHLLLAEGAHNQFGDLPWTARVEMLMEQWLLARPEIQGFLRGRQMVPYQESWMGTVDAMKKLQGWDATTVTHFHDLARYGEQILLSVRYGNWVDANDENQAKNWARYWKPEVQGYIHAYRAVTGVDLTSEPVDATPPWVHLKRLEEGRRAGRR